MKRYLKNFACIVLVTLLLSGCAKGTASSIETSTENIVAVSSSSDVPLVSSNWRQIYYDIAVEFLEKEQGELSYLEMYYVKDAPPLLRISAKMGETNKSLFWKIENGQAVNTFAGSGYYAQVNYKNGNPVEIEYGYENSEPWETRVSEIINGEKVFQYEYRIQDDGSKLLYTYVDDKLWTWEEEAVENPTQQYPYMNSNDNLFLIDQQIAKEVLENYFLGTPSFNIEQGAPAWVSEYVRYILLQGYADQDSGWLQNISILSTGNTGTNPIIVLKDDYQRVYICLFEEGIQSTLARGSIGYTFYADEKGTIFRNGNYGMPELDSHWYSLERYGYNWLLQEKSKFITLADGTSGAEFSIQAQKKDFSEWEEAHVWLEVKRDEILVNMGYVPPLQQLPETKIQLPEAYTNETLEALLIEAFCKYAKENGMWE